MKRQKLTGSPRRWFDRDRARRYPGTVRFFRERGVWVSRATGGFYSREDLYRTASGRWVVHWWSLWQNGGQTWREVPGEEAAAWLERCGYTEEARKLREALHAPRGCRSGRAVPSDRAPGAGRRRAVTR